MTAQAVVTIRQATLNIMVRVQSRQAQQALSQLGGSVGTMGSTFGGATAGAARMGKSLDQIATKAMNTGNTMGWIGRQIEYSFTLPILAAAVAGTKWALEAEKNMTRLKKVYGSAQLEKDLGADVMESEVNALGEAFLELSNKFGVVRAEVVNIGADWAAAGASGIALAKATELTLRTMILGELKAEESTRALIAIQAQYGLSTKELEYSLAQLNAIENETAVSTGDLVLAFEKTANVARSAGVDVRHLGAMVAAISPEAGKAGEAGNGLKTMLSRLMSPTRDMADVLGRLNINIADTSWNSADAVTKLEMIAQAFGEADISTQNFASRIIASGWQVNKFGALMKAMTEETSMYHRALDATSNEVDVLRVAEEELQTVLSSSPQRLQQIWVILQNVAAEIAQPLIPMITALGATLARLGKWVADLDPYLRNLIITLVLLVAALGTFVRIAGTIQAAWGSLLMIFGALAPAVGRLFTPFTALLTLPFKPFTAGANKASSAVLNLLRSPVNKQLGSWQNSFNNFADNFKITKVFTGAFKKSLSVLWAFGDLLVDAFDFIGKSAVYKGFLNGMKGLPGVALDAGKTIASGLKTGLLAIPTLFMSTGKSAADGLGAGLSTVGGFFSKATDAAWDGARGINRAVQSIPFRVTDAMQTAHARGFAIWTGFMVDWERQTKFYGSSVLGLFGLFGTGISSALDASAKRSRAIWKGFTGWFSATGWIGIALARFKLMMTSLPLLMASGVGRMRKIWTSFQLWWATAVVGGGLFTKAWAAMTGGMVKIWGAAHSAMLKIYAIFQTRLAAMMAGGAILRAFGSMGKGMIAAFAAIPRAINKGFRTLLKKGFKGILTLAKRFGGALVRILLGPWGLVLTGIGLLIGIFWDQLRELFSRIAKGFSSLWSGVTSSASGVTGFFQRFVNALKKYFWSLPVEIQNAMLAVVRVISNAAKAVYRWLQYLNPFARHSPSLVENVHNGVAAINSSFENLSQISGPISAAYSQIDALKSLAGSLYEQRFAVQYADDLAMVADHAPQAVGAFQSLVNMLPDLTREHDALGKQVKSQEQVLKQWQAALDNATAAVKAQEAAIQRLQDQAEQYSTIIQNAESTISDLAGAPLVGMRAMEDQIHANTMAQNKLKLAMMDLEDAGGSYDDIQSKIGSINGEIESLSAKRLELQAGGAGSEILSFYDEQIAALQGQKIDLGSGMDVGPLQEMQAELDRLQKEADRLDLVKAVQFDDAVYQIERLADSEKELTFEQITSGIQSAQAEVAKYTPMLNSVNQEIAAQEQALKALEAQKDAVQAQYDAEDAKLQQIKDKYEELGTAIQDVESALGSMGQAASDAQKLAEAGVSGALDVSKARKIKKSAGSSGGAGDRLTWAQEGFDASVGGNYDIPGGSGMLGREAGALGGMGDQTADIEAFTAELALGTGDMLASLDMFAPLRKKWDEFRAWVDEHIRPAFAPIRSGWEELMDGIDWGAPFRGLREAVSGGGGESEGGGGWLSSLSNFIKGIPGMWDNLQEMVGQVSGVLGKIFNNDFKTIIEETGQGLSEMWTNMQPGMERVFPVLEKIAYIIGTVIGVAVIILGAAFKLLVSILGNVVRPVLAFIGDLFSNLMIIIDGALKVIWGILTLDLGMIVSGIGDILYGLLHTIGSLFNNLVAVVVGILKGLWDFIYDIFMAIWDYLVGHSIVPDTINAIIDWFGKLPGAIWGFLTGIWNSIVTWATGVYNSFVDFCVRVVDAWSRFWSDLWNWVVNTTRDIWNAITNWVNNVRSTISDFINRVVAAWNKFWSDVWDYVVRTVQNIWNSITTWVNNVRNTINNFISLVITAWNNFWQNIRDRANEFITLIRNGIDTGLNAVRGFFQSAVDFIVRIWDGLKSAVSEPIRFIIDTVINNGIIKGWNDLVGLLRLDSLKVGTVDVPGFESGGVLSGNAPSHKDNMRVVDQYGITRATVRSGEGIIREPAMKRFTRNHPGAFEYINRYGAVPDGGNLKDIPAFFRGGVLPTPGPVRPHSLPYHGAQYAADMGYGTGSPVYAWKGGEVRQVMYANSSYGNRIRVGHNPGHTLYAHLSQIGVAVGQIVKAGELIGRIGYSGNVRPRGPGGAHLHFEIREGAVMDPGDSGGGGISGFFEMAIGWVTDKLMKPVEALIERVPGAGHALDLAKGTAKNLLDAAVEKVKSIIPGGDENVGFVPGGSGSVPGLSGVTANTYAKAANIYNAAVQAGHRPSSVGGWRSDWEHSSKRALDFMVGNNKAAGDYIASYVLSNASRFGLQHVIWWQRINSGSGWRGMSNRGSRTANHMDHPHVFFNASDKALAKGTNAARQGWHLVGEAGPELVKFNGGESVFSNTRTNKLMAEQLDTVIRDLRTDFTNAFMAVLIRANLGQQGAAVDAVVAVTRDAARRIDARERAARRDEPISESRSSGTVNINKAEFIFPNVKDGNDAEAFLKNLEEYLRRKGN